MGNYQRLSSNDMREKQAENLKRKLSKKKGAFNVLKKVFNYSREYRFYLYFSKNSDNILRKLNEILEIEENELKKLKIQISRILKNVKAI